MKRQAVLLANMGAPVSEPDMRVFLKRMFNDKAILYAPSIVRTIISDIISVLRYKSSWKKYELIGGSPLQKSMQATAEQLQLLVGSDYHVCSVYSYSEPFIETKIAELNASGVHDFAIISMYPQASFSTTGSVQTSLDKMQTKLRSIQIRFIEDYFDAPLFIQYWARLIRQKINEMGYQKPHLLFSAHAIPQSFSKRGDRYAEKMRSSAYLIAESLDLPYHLSYQSKIGHGEWTRPYTVDMLKTLYNNNINEIVVVPLSFVNENLETRFDLDTELIPFALNELGVKQICRVVIPMSDDILVSLFYNFIKSER